MRLIVRAAANMPFNLNLIISPDNGTTTVIAQQVASSVLNADGSTGGYPNVAELDTQVPWLYRLDAFPKSGGAFTIIGEAREYA